LIHLHKKPVPFRPLLQQHVLRVPRVKPSGWLLLIALEICISAWLPSWFWIPGRLPGSYLVWLMSLACQAGSPTASPNAGLPSLGSRGPAVVARSRLDRPPLKQGLLHRLPGSPADPRLPAARGRLLGRFRIITVVVVAQDAGMSPAAGLPDVDTMIDVRHFKTRTRPDGVDPAWGRGVGFRSRVASDPSCGASRRPVGPATSGQATRQANGQAVR
jgi:hypothetical protein